MKATRSRHRRLWAPGLAAIYFEGVQKQNFKCSIVYPQYQKERKTEK